MKTKRMWQWYSRYFSVPPIIIAVFMFGATSSLAQMLPPGAGGGLTNAPLDSWSFNDTNSWTDDASNTPVSFTNITGMMFGDATSMTLASTNPAWLNYNIYEPTGATNLTVDQGSFFVWFAPAWAGTNEGGTGPGQYGRLLEVGGYTPGASFGWWSLYTDPAGANLYFTVQPGDGSTTTYLTAPIAWASNSWNFIALTYCATNTALYLNGVLATNGPGLSNWPGTNVLAGGFYLGSDSNGLNQASGSFDDLYTYNVPLDASAIASGYNLFWADYYLTPWNYMSELVSAPSNPSTNSTTPDVITGAGYLQSDGIDYGCSYNTNAYFVWITNIVTTPSSNGMVNVTFSINGGQSGYMYDVFAIGTLPVPLSSGTWSWMGQGPSCYRYTIPNINSADCFIILGTPQDSDGDGLTDAYELLVSHTDPHNADSNLDGILDGWEILLGLNPSQSNIGNSAESLDYTYTAADWIYGISGIKPASNVIMDNEGNVKQVSQ
jgi:hypothetical protein